MRPSGVKPPKETDEPGRGRGLSPLCEIAFGSTKTWAKLIDGTFFDYTWVIPAPRDEALDHRTDA